MVRILTACLFLQFVSTLGTPTRGKFKAEYRQKLGENPEGVALTVRLESGRQWFRVGEVIRLQLSFTSQIPDKYQLNLRTCDRSGRLTLDLPCVNPTEGTVDPLAGYFGAIFGYIGGGASAPQKVLGQEPVSASLVLNEHLRFDRTGRYRLFIVSTRVEPIGHHRDLSVASNAIDLEILQADESWQKRQITGAVARLRDESDCTGQEEVCQILRYLGTTGTVEAILDEYPSTDEYCRSEFSFGLMGAPLPLRDYAVREMTLRLKDSHYPVRPRFFQDLVLLTYMTQHPDYIYSTGTPRANLLDRRRAYERISVQRLKDLVGAIEDKKGHALAVSALALLQSLRSTDVRKAFEGNVEALRTRLPAVFGLLSRENQKTLLGYDWRVIRHPDLLPALRQIIDEKPRLLRRQEPVRDAALRRLYELAPAEGRQRILREIESGNSTFAATTLGILPDKTLPELDDELMTQVESSTTDLDRADLSSHLVARYASDSILPRVLRWVRPRLDDYACRPLYALTAYTLRVSPEDGLGLVREVLCIRKRTGCFRSILKSVADLHIDSGLVALAVESLEDADLDVVTSAAETLRDYGTAGAQGRSLAATGLLASRGREPGDGSGWAGECSGMDGLETTKILGPCLGRRARMASGSSRAASHSRPFSPRLSQGRVESSYSAGDAGTAD